LSHSTFPQQPHQKQLILCLPSFRQIIKNERKEEWTSLVFLQPSGFKMYTINWFSYDLLFLLSFFFLSQLGELHEVTAKARGEHFKEIFIYFITKKWRDLNACRRSHRSLYFKISYHYTIFSNEGYDVSKHTPFYKILRTYASFYFS